MSILNTGHLGYSPEQEFHTLVEYADRFHPQFVVLSLFANDFGGIDEVVQGGGDWDDSNYWIGEILQYCRSKGMICLVVPVPLERQVFARRFAGHYQGRISNYVETSGQDYIDPIEDFVDEHIKLLIEGERAHHRPANCPLYNGRIADGHFSAAGCRSGRKPWPVASGCCLKKPAMPRSWRFDPGMTVKPFFSRHPRFMLRQDLDRPRVAESAALDRRRSTPSPSWSDHGGWHTGSSRNHPWHAVARFDGAHWV